jgi:hypothetical protein
VIVTLYTRPGCHLCEEAKELLVQLGARYPHRLDECNIDGDQALRARYHLTIPVIRVGDAELAAPIRKPELEALLRSASHL